MITEAILSYYFHIVKVVNIIDRDMLFYDSIINAVRTYLIKRPDILKSIISCWKESGHMNMAVDSSSAGETYKVLDMANYHGLESDDDEEEAEKWDVQNVDSRESKTGTFGVNSSPEVQVR